VFTALHAPGRDPSNLEDLRQQIAPLRHAIHDLLAKGTRCRDPKTRRFCEGLLAHETALWTFTSTPGVPATNNASERALRHAVHWRRTSYGTQTATGNRIVERLLTLRETCRLQGRRLHQYLTTAISRGVRPSASSCRSPTSSHSVVHYQPKVELDDSTVQAPRLAHPELGLLGPVTFIPAVERRG